MAVSSTALLTLAELKALLGLPASASDADARLEALINACSVAIENLTGRYFVIREGYVERHFPPKQNGWPYVQDYAGWSHGQTLFLRRYPVVALTSVVDPSGFSIPLTEINVRHLLGELYRSGGWFMPIDTFGTPAQWAITYDVGYAVTIPEVEAPVKLACAMLVGFRSSNFVPGSDVASRTLGKVSVSFHGAGMGVDAIAQGIPDEIVQLLGPYMSRDV